MRDIILFGEMGSGKDMIADILTEFYGYYKVKLGKYIRAHVKQLAYLPGFDERNAMQDYGQFCRNLFGEDVWNIVALNELMTYRKAAYMGSGEVASIVIADGRQLNEWHFWKAHGFVPVGVIADKAKRAERLIKRDGIDQSHRFNHSTEKQAKYVVDNLCRLIIDSNEDGKKALIPKVKTLMEELEAFNLSDY